MIFSDLRDQAGVPYADRPQANIIQSAVSFYATGEYGIGGMMKITVLIENTGEAQLEAEHGLSLFIEYNKKRYLLDAGQSGAFVRNAQRLGLDTGCADYAVLSHGHYDHADGFLPWLRRYPEKKIFARSAGWRHTVSEQSDMYTPVTAPDPRQCGSSGNTWVKDYGYSARAVLSICQRDHGNDKCNGTLS